MWTVGGSWATFGGAFATSIVNGNPGAIPSAISRNGRFAALAYNDQVALVSLAGTPLRGNPNGNQASRRRATSTRPASTTAASARAPRSSLVHASGVLGPEPKRAHVTVGDGTATLLEADWTKPLPYPNAGNTEADFINVRFPVGTPHTRTLELAVVDAEAARTRSCSPAP